MYGTTFAGHPPRQHHIQVEREPTDKGQCNEMMRSALWTVKDFNTEEFSPSILTKPFEPCLQEPIAFAESTDTDGTNRQQWLLLCYVPAMIAVLSFAFGYSARSLIAAGSALAAWPASGPPSWTSAS